MAGASSGSGPVGFFFNRKTEVPRVVEHVGMWLLTVPEDGRERVVAQVESECFNEQRRSRRSRQTSQKER